VPRHLNIAAALVCAVILALAAVPAHAGIVSKDTYVTNGWVEDVAIHDGFTYLGGTFTMVGPRIGIGMEVGQSGSGAPDTSTFPEVAGGSISTVAADGSGGWFIGGGFSHVGGVARTSLAHIRADGTLDETWNPAPNSAVEAIAVSGSDVYVGGWFSSIGGQARNRIAKLSATGSGAADATWNPNASSTVLALAVAGSDVYAGGTFTSIGGQSRGRLAKLSATGSGTADATWNPGPDQQVEALVVSGSDL
jgi:trimeric autotransporter adhesin